MIRLFTARENIAKERFIYEHIAGEALVIVPNQYTLEAEQQALKYMDTKCLFNVEILSMNRLGLRVLTEQGLESTDMLDRYGRFMLLNRIIKAHKDELNIFANSVGKLTFTTMVSDFISDFKQQNCSMDEVREMLNSNDADVLLKDKLTELEGIIEEYEKAIEGQYTDSEDYISMYVAAIKDSKFLAGKKIWLYEFDSVTPKFLEAVLELAARCDEVNFVINRSDFELDDALIKRLTDACNERGEAIQISEIGSEYELSKTETIARIERGLFNDEAVDNNADFLPEDLTVVRAANPYYEAESAAAYIYHLVRDLGYKMKDIQVIANDEGVMQQIIRRTFEEYGLPVFMDQSRNITDSTAVNFIMNMLWFVRYGGKTDALLAMLKTGLAGVERDDVSSLENYARNYHIKGNMWKSPFKYGESALGDEFARLEDMRAQLIEPMNKLERLASGTVGEFVSKFKSYLETEWQLADRVERAADEQAAAGMREEAQRSVESYKAALRLLDQIVEIMGNEPLDIDEFTDIYMAGLTNVEVGVIPPTVDGLSMGTMIRTRPGEVRAVVVLGANEGVMPLEPSPEGLFSVDEKSYFRDRGFALGSLDDIKAVEEQVAMYRMLSKPSDKLYISYSMTDADGKEAAASSIIDALLDLFPRLEKDGLVQKDVISAGWSTDYVNASDASMRHLFNHLKDRKTATKMDTLTEALLAWHKKNSDDYESMMRAARDENNPKSLGADVAKGLYAGRDGAFKMSASSIGSYFDCPFKYYVDRGLRPEEEREFAGDARSIGDVYHQCLMVIAKKIIDEPGYGEKLVNCSDADLLKIVSDELDAISSEYREGVFESNETEEYRLSRIKEICAAASRAMAIQLTDESVTSARFEEGFGRGREFKPVEIEVNGEKFFIEGQIDRADIMGDRVRIVDYKTGADKLDVAKMAKGYKMQLMVYMMSAMQDGYEPAGMFYFNIFDPIEGYNDVDENKVNKKGEAKKDETAADRYKLKGVSVADEGGISREDFDQLRSDVEERITEIAEGISGGNIGIHPFKDGGRLVCNYCKYGAICKRDRTFFKNKAREI